MKLSEAVDLLWEAATPAVRDKKDLEAALLCIAPGHKWDPEEKPLPQKIRLAWNCGLPELLPLETVWESKEDALRGYAEAIRRYNLMPHLRSFVSLLTERGYGSTARELEMILDGGAS